MKILCVAEKPSIARSISGILAGGELRTRNSPCKYVKNFDFTYRLPPPQNGVQVTFTSVLGHLASCDFAPEYSKWDMVDPISLFDAPIVTSYSKDMQPVVQNLKDEARYADWLMIWTDCDREGEHIGYEIERVCKTTRRNIVVKRARFSSVIANQIHTAMREPTGLDMDMAYAVEARIHLDLRLGSVFTRLQTLGLRNVINDVGVVSYGPCQFPTLGFIVDQWKKVRDFVPEDFWYIYLDKERDGKKAQFNWKRVHLFDVDCTFAIYSRCIANPNTTVTSIKTSPTRNFKPYPLTTIELQKKGSRILKLSAKKILDLAEKLYHQGFLSYPRTETDQFDPKFDFATLIDKQTVDLSWGGFAQRLKNGEFQRPRDGKHNDKAHPPIHPIAHVSNLPGDEKRVYEFITRHFLACCHTDAVGASTEIEVEMAREIFTAKGLVVQELNYLEVYIYDKWSTSALPVFHQDEVFVPSVCEMRSGQTSSPSYLTEADLITLMDNNGIGTDATMANHIETIINREYVFKRKQGTVERLLPSDLGIGLLEGYDEIDLEKSLAKPLLRRETEEGIKLVCEAVESKDVFLQRLIAQYREMYLRVKDNFGSLSASVRRHRNHAPNNNGGGGFDEDPPDRPHHPGGGGGAGGGGGGGARRGAGSRGAGRGGRQGTQTLPGRENGPGAEDNSDGDDEFPGAQRKDARSTRPTTKVHSRHSSNARHSQDLPPKVPKTAVKPETNSPAPDCKCDAPAIQRIVQKEGPTQGRTFWTCMKPREDQCDFFQWADEPAPIQGGFGAQRAATHPTSTAEQPRLRCLCDLIAVRKETTKPGPNQGRAFWTCGVNSTITRCKFFQWEDEMDQRPHSETRGYARAPLQPTGSDASGSAPNKTCYKCGQSGHWANACTGSESTSTIPRNRNKSFDRGDSDVGGFVCYKCNQPGHFANACTSADSSHQRKQHTKSRPNNNRSSAKKPRGSGEDACYKCGNTGHWASNCTG